jgi:hypothetical protein
VRRHLASLFMAGALLGLGCRQIAGIEDVQPVDAGKSMEARAGGPGGTCGCPGCTTLASAQGLPLSLVLVDGYVYFLDYGPEDGQGSLMRVATGGGQPETVVGNLTRPFSIAADATNFYWQAEDAKGGIVVKRAIAGGAPETLASGLPPLTDLVTQSEILAPTTNDIALSTTDVYFVGFSPGNFGGPEPLQIESVPIAGGAVKPFISQWPNDSGSPDGGEGYVLYPLAIVTDSRSVYLITSAGQIGVLKVPIAGGVTDVLVENLENPYALALDGTILVFTDDGNFTNGLVETVPTSGGSPSILAKGVAPWEMVVSQGTVYFINTDQNAQVSSIDSLDLTGNKLTTLATTLPEPVAITVDSESIYWTDSFCGTVMKMHK